MIESKYIVLSLCHKKKYGLSDISEALVGYGNTLEKHIRFIHVQTLSELLAIITKHKSKILCSISWDNSRSTFTKVLILYLSRIKNIYYYHEPMGIRYKLSMKASLTYSIISSFAEILFKIFSSYKAVSLEVFLNKGNFYLPLLYDEVRPKKNNKNNKTIGFVGFKKKERLPRLYEDVMSILKRDGYKAAYFPSEQYGFTKKAKLKFLSEVSMVWNVFVSPYTQSAVTADAFMSNTPLILSNHEPFKKLLKKHNLALFVSPNDSKEIISRRIVKFLETQKNPSKNLPKDISMFGGSEAYLKYWQPVFNKIFMEKK